MNDSNNRGQSLLHVAAGAFGSTVEVSDQRGKANYRAMVLHSFKKINNNKKIHHKVIELRVCLGL